MMSKEELLDYYRNLYQVTKQEKEELKKELEQYKNIVTIKNDIIDSLHKRIDKLETQNCKLLVENQFYRDQEKLSSAFTKIDKDSLKITKINQDLDDLEIKIVLDDLYD